MGIDSKHKSRRSSSSQPQTSPMIHSCIMRDEVLLVEVKTKVAQLKESDRVVRNLTQKKVVEGCYVYTDDDVENSTKGLRFDVHQLRDETDYICWKLICVYDPVLIQKHFVQAFFETVLEQTRVYRENELQWKYGKKYACQINFASTLNHLMKSFTTCGKISSNCRGKNMIDFTVEIINSNNKLLEQRHLEIQGARLREQRLVTLRNLREGSSNLLRSWTSKLYPRSKLSSDDCVSKCLNETDLTEISYESEQED